MNFNNFIQKQKEDLINEFKNDMSMCLISTTPERITRHSIESKWKISYLSSSKPTSAIVIQKPDKLPELWVNRSYTRYRRAFSEYLKKFHGFKDNKIPRNLQVDHLQSTYRFRKEHPVYFIRLHLIERSINASYGAGFEKSFYQNERNKIPNGGIHMDWVTFLKAYGVKLPSKKNSVSEWATWAWYLATELENRDIDNVIFAYHGISTVLNLGYTGKYAPLPLQASFKDEALRNPTISYFPGLIND